VTAFGDIVSRSVYGTTGFIAAIDDLAAVELAITNNLPLLDQFQQVIVATNYGDSQRDELRAANASLWRHYLPDCVLMDSDVNRGHSIGTSDLDNILFDYCKDHGITWLCKGANDVYLDAQVLTIPVVDADFYYLNAVSFSALRQHDFDLALFTGDFFFPQTTFYAINVGATDFLVDKRFLDASWKVVNRIPHYNNRIWEHIPGWSCEYLLRQCVERNDLTRCHLMTDEQWREVLQTVIDRRIEDCSFKGMAINGICHEPAELG
jgi:hypothetical protein